MLVENVVEFTHQKFANMCAHLESTYGDAIGTAQMRAVPAVALFVLLKNHLLPHAALVEACDAMGLIAVVEEPSVASLATLCKDDAKLLRYLKLFCELVA